MKRLFTGTSTGTSTIGCPVHYHHHGLLVTSIIIFIYLSTTVNAFLNVHILPTSFHNRNTNTNNNNHIINHKKYNAIDINHNHDINVESDELKSGKKSISTSSSIDDDDDHNQDKKSTKTGKKKRQRIPVLQYHDDWVCINKPCGLTVHRSRNVPRHVGVLTSKLKRQLGRKVYPIHRLDHRTSGMMLLAFDSKVAGRLHADAILNGKKKQYVALVRGTWKYPSSSIIIDKPLVVQNNITKSAKTKFTVLATTTTTMTAKEGAGTTTTTITSNDDRFDITTDSNNSDKTMIDDSYNGEACLLLCEPIQSGRYHQIRRHAMSIGYPIIGDTQHGNTKINRYWRNTKQLNFLALHCWKIQFNTTSSTGSTTTKQEFEHDDDQQEQHECIAPLSLEFQRILQSTTLWNDAIEKEPQLSMMPYDVTGGTFGRHYRSKQQQQQKEEEDTTPL